MAKGSTIAVYSAIAGNSLVTIAKLIGFILTGSGAMFSETLHSFADVSNQALLALGIHQSKKRSDKYHPYGYTREAFVWALISAVGIFFLGCGVTVYHGVTALLHPHEIQSIQIALAVLAFSFVIEGACLLVALKGVMKDAKANKTPLKEYLKHGPDPMGAAVILEDTAAVLGVVLAAGALITTQYTLNPFWDALATLVIGLMMGAIGIFLIIRNRILLIGPSMRPERKDRVMQALGQDVVIEEVHDVKTTIMGPDKIRFKAEIDFDGEKVAARYLEKIDLQATLDTLNSAADLKQVLIQHGEHVIEALGDEIDRLEKKIREIDPRIKHVDLEND